MITRLNSKIKPNWFDMLVYRLAYWRWNKILKSRPDLRELAIANLKTFDVIDEGELVKISVTIEKVLK